MRWPTWAGRPGPAVAEVALFAALAVTDAVVGLRGGLPHGLVATVATDVGPGGGQAAAMLVLLRRRFSDRIALIGGCVVAISLLGTVCDAVAVVDGQRLPVELNVTATVALAVLAGAAVRRLPVRSGAMLAALSGVAMVASPVLRHGTSRADSLIAVAAAVMWGVAVAVGLLLRDADARRDAALAELRSAERLRLARELHDLVAHHITGVVVRVQAARIVSARQRPDDGGEGPDAADALFGEIEAAGAEALAAMRRLVRMLRTDGDEPPGGPARITDAVISAVPADSGVSVRVPPAVAALAVLPEVTSTVHWIVMESLTNARRHAPAASEIVVELRIADEPAGRWLAVEVSNDAAPPSSPAGGQGYGLVGMTERVTALGGNLRAGPEPGERWLVSARLPIAGLPAEPGGQS